MKKVNADEKIVWIHNDYVSAMHPKKYDYSHLKNMSKIVSISDSCVDILKQVFPEFADKVYCLPNLTSSTVLQKRAEEFYPQEYDKNGINILSIGRLHDQKGFDMAIKAAKIMKEQKKGFQVVRNRYGRTERGAYKADSGSRCSRLFRTSWRQGRIHILILRTVQFLSSRPDMKVSQ